MDRQEMSNEENYAFDVAGYLHIPAVLKTGEVAALHEALDAVGQLDGMLGWEKPHRELFRELMVHPQLVWYLNQLVGHGFRLDRAPRLFGSSEKDISESLAGGDEPRDPARAYYVQKNRRSCQGIKAIWVLEDVDEGAGGLHVVQASHKTNVETPAELLTLKDDMGLVKQPVLKAGDLFLLAETTLHGMLTWSRGPRRLLTYGYAARAAIQSPGPGVAAEDAYLPDWAHHAPPEQGAVLNCPGYRDASPPPMLASDGKSTWVTGRSEVIHPSIYLRDPNSGIDEKEVFFWDLSGYLVVRGVMDEAWLEEANAAVDSYQDRVVVGSELARGSKSQAGTGRPLLSGLLDLPDPDNAPFRKMIAHPAVISRLNWMKGSGYRTGGATVFCAVDGTSGHALHDGNEPMSPSRGYFFKNGRSYAETVTITWQLRDVEPGMGGFAAVPGSHKTQYSMPPGIRTCDDTMGLVVQPAMKAGDVLFFMDGGCTHGALAWRNPIARRGVLVKYQSRNANWGGGIVDPKDRWGDMVEDMTEEQFSLMRGPERDARDRTIPRLGIVAGQTRVSYDAEGDSYAARFRKPGER
ncbi:MAG: phytanoyl-CoA dioxygenase family protein [bacterium]|nr:phytanoyl-CoA dioxygenase family protein [bacterium]